MSIIELLHEDYKAEFINGEMIPAEKTIEQYWVERQTLRTTPESG